MSIGKQEGHQGSMWIAYDQVPRSRGHAFYDQLQRILCKGGFDAFAERLCAPFYAETMGRPSIPPGRYFRMLLVGYFEGIDSERGICWRCADSLSLREFLRLGPTDTVPDHSSLSRIRRRLSLEAHHGMFVHVLALLARGKLLEGKNLGIDASTMEANAAMRSIVRRDTGEGYRTMLERLAKESGIATPTQAELTAFDRKRKGKKLSNDDWQSPVDNDARIAKLKDGRTHLAHKPEHVVDLDSGAIVSVKIHHADEGDTTTIHKTLKDTRKKLKSVKKKSVPKYDAPAELVADKGYHSRKVLKNLDGAFRSRISVPKATGICRWHGDHEARRAVYNNRARTASAKSKALLRKRGELVERSFAHCLDSGGMRRTHLRGTENIEKRYVLHVAGFNLGLLMRSLFGVGTPKGWADAPACLVMFICEDRYF
ncbi:transposase, partial [Desulfovibrio sp. OttesenSCG-928-A18]|nr:transposase [Desulfovibrio sp. OttesenSCG-928-A18]